MCEPFTWQKSSFSSTEPENSCLEVAGAPGGLLLREGEAPGDVLLTLTRRLAGLLRAVRGDLAEIPAGRHAAE